MTIAVDFDGCLVTAAWPEIGEPNWPVINELKERIAKGAKVILWTCREDLPERAYLTEAIAAGESFGIHFDAVNDGLPEHVEYFGANPRKIYADEYWDDKAVRMPREN